MTEQEGSTGALQGVQDDLCEQEPEVTQQQSEAVDEAAVVPVEQEPVASEQAGAEAAEAAGQTDDAAQAAEPEHAEAEEPAAQEVEPEQVAAVAETAETAPEASENKPKKKRIGLKVGIGIAAALVAALGCLTGWMYADDTTRVQHVPSHTMLDGAVDISGMTHDEVKQAVEQRAKLGYSTQADLTVDGKSYTIKLSDVGKLDVDKTVEQAFSPYNGESFIQRGMRAITANISGAKDEVRNVTTVCEVDKSKLKKRVKKIAAKVDCPAQNAGYYYDSSAGQLIASKGQNGIKVDQKATVKALSKALENPNGTQQVEAVAKVTEPDVKHSGQAIFVDTGACRLYLYEDGDQVIDWACSPGRDGYATPKGDWYLSYKDPSPTWYNPHAEWSVGMPDVWQPGADNPLGLRALAVSCGDGIFIHGTINYAMLGSRDSHGCVRLANENIVELYDRVSEGIPIIIR